MPLEAQLASQAAAAHTGGKSDLRPPCLGRVLYKNLERMWAKLEPVCQDLLLDAGHRQRAPCFQDFLWAYSIFWYFAASGCACTLLD